MMAAASDSQKKRELIDRYDRVGLYCKITTFCMLIWGKHTKLAIKTILKHGDCCFF